MTVLQDGIPIRSRCSSHSAGGSTARSNRVMWFGGASSRMGVSPPTSFRQRARISAIGSFGQPGDLGRY